MGLLPFHTEAWIWYGINITIILCRFAARILHLRSIKKLQLDDYLMMIVVISETSFMVAINHVFDDNSNLIPPGVDISEFTPQDIKDRVNGSKLVVVVEQMQCMTIWLLKLCLAILYLRVTKGFSIYPFVKLLTAYVAITFVIMEILYLGVWCRPFSNYWAVPTPNIQCSTAMNHLITNAVFNLSSDVCMVIIALTLFLNNSLSWSRKLILCFIFGLGLFTILSAILNKYYSFKHPYGSEWSYWYVRESSTAIIVANLPFCWAIIRRLFNVGSWNNTSATEMETGNNNNTQIDIDHNNDNHHNSSFISRTFNVSHSTSEKSRKSSTYPTSPLTSFRSPSPSNFIHNRHISIETSKNCKSWKEAGIYGLSDVDALGIYDDDDDEDDDNDGDDNDDHKNNNDTNDNNNDTSNNNRDDDNKTKTHPNTVHTRNSTNHSLYLSPFSASTTTKDQSPKLQSQHYNIAPHPSDALAIPKFLSPENDSTNPDNGIHYFQFPRKESSTSSENQITKQSDKEMV